MARKSSLGNWFMSLPWIARLLLAIVLDIVLGIIRFIDGLREGNLIKIILGFLWIFYGCGVGWVLDIIFCVLGLRPLLM